MKKSPANAGFFFPQTIVMDTKNRTQSSEEKNPQQEPQQQRINNPFEDHQSAEEDIQASKEKLDKEQQFKEAMTERD